MKVKSPRPINLKGTRKEAVLLLHSFTGTIRDVKPLAQKLNQEGYTCYAPNYKGHGLPLDQFTQYTVHDWWNDVLNGYQYLKDEGYETIYATGVSLGGLFTLKLVNGRRSENCGYVDQVKKKKRYSMAYGTIWSYE